jgi:hypothetical protein
MKALANRSGLTEGDAAGLRIGDLAQISHGLVYVARSFHGPLKEERAGSKPPPILQAVPSAELKFEPTRPAETRSQHRKPPTVARPACPAGGSQFDAKSVGGDKKCFALQ